MSEVSKMVCNAIVACLDPAQSMLIVALISRFSGNLVNDALKKSEKCEIDATFSILCAGSKHATIALQTILKTYYL